LNSLNQKQKSLFCWSNTLWGQSFSVFPECQFSSNCVWVDYHGWRNRIGSSYCFQYCGSI